MAQPYLTRLETLGIVHRTVPVTVPSRQRTREGVYRIADPFVRFWFRFVAPSTSAPEQGRAREVRTHRVEPGLPDSMGVVFEEAVRAHTWLLARAGRLSFEPDTVGSSWDARAERDVVAVRHATREAYLALCTWAASALHPRALDDLRRKAAHFHTVTGYIHRGLALYARRRFAPGLEAAARKGRRGSGHGEEPQRQVPGLVVNSPTPRATPEEPAPSIPPGCAADGRGTRPVQVHPPGRAVRSASSPGVERPG